MASYFVANAGSNANAGTQASPWQTIAHAVSSSTAGDTVNLNGGDTFTENVSLSSGRTIQSYGTGQATISGGSNPAIAANNCDGITIANLVATQNQISGYMGVPCPGVIYFLATDGNRHGNGIQVTGCTVTGGLSGISFYQTDGGHGGFNNVLIQGNVVTNCVEYGILFLTYTFEAGTDNYSNIRVIGNTVSGVTGDQNENGSVGSGICCDGLLLTGPNAGPSLISGNLVYDCGAECNSATPEGNSGIEIGVSQYVTISGNVVYNQHANNTVDGVGIDIDEDCYNCIAEYNFTCNNQGAGYQLFWIQGGNIVRFNISVNDCNLVTDEDAGALVINPLGGTSFIYNNTVISQNAFPAVLMRVTAGIKFFNNILVSATGVPTVNILAPGGSGFAMSGNSYLSGAGSFFSHCGSDCHSLPAWRTATGQETGTGFLGGATFVSLSPIPTPTPAQLATLTNYQLVTGSPLVFAGLDLLSLFGVNPGSQDFQGNPLAVPYSVGAINPAWGVLYLPYEFTSTLIP
jgi:hypothetical protein